MNGLYIHDLKIAPEYYEAVRNDVKNFEIRKNDRNFNVGDLLILREFDGEYYTGQELTREVTYISDYEQKQGYVVMAIK